MAKKRENESARDPDAYEQAYDERGSMRLDRKFTLEEAQAQDAAHREQAERARAERWEWPAPPAA